jgi:hypothetical protein
MLRNHKQTIILLIISVCVLVALIASAVFLYNFIKIKSTSIISAKTEIATLEAKEKDLNNTKNDLELLKKDIEKIDQAFLSEESFVTFLKLLEMIAQKSGVMFQAETANLPQSSGGKAELSFRVQGDYPSIIKFFALFDQIPYAGIIDQVSILPDNTKKTELTARARYVIFNFLSQ